MAQTISIIDVILAKALAISASKAYTDQKTQSLMGGVHYRGQVDYYDDLPNDPEEGDSYTVRYAGSSGTVADGTEYTWGVDSSTNTMTWISFSKDAYSKAETDLLLAAKQSLIDASNKLDGSLVGPLTGYVAAATAAALDPTDTLLQALGKLEKAADDNKNNILLIEHLNGAKNYIYYAGTSETITTGGANLQVTNNGDGTLTIDGTTGSNDVYITITKNSVVPLSLSTGSYVLSGVDTIATSVGFVITPYGAGTQIAALYPPQTSAIVNISTTGNYTCVAKVIKNTTVDHALIKPMLIDKSVWDGGLVDFKQYAMSNAEITAWILAHS